MKKGLILLALALMSWSTAGSAFAGPFGRFRGGHPQQQQQRPAHPDDAREGDKERGEKGNQNALQQGGGAREGVPAQQIGPQPVGRGARMSVEERQKLRRQINEAGRSLYTPPTGNK